MKAFEGAIFRVAFAGDDKYLIATGCERPMSPWGQESGGLQRFPDLAHLNAVVKTDGTDMGFKPLKLISGADAAAPVSPECKMVRPPA